LRTIKDIKVVVYNKADSSNDIVRKILSMGGIDKIACDNEDNFESRIEELQKNGYSSKEVLILKNFKGRFLQKCPGSPKVICCNYHVLNTCFNCIFNCSYCYMRSYLNSFGITQFINMEGLYESLAEFINTRDRDKIFRIGTGEFTDSMMIDEVTGIGRRLIEIASSHKNIMMELKTKSSRIDHLLDIKDKGSAVMAWSLNTPVNIQRYEKDSASLEERISAARKAVSAGYFTAFHFDPIIIYEGWKEDYRKVIDLLFESVNPDKIVWISMGGFRYHPDFKDVVKKYPDDMELFSGEMFPGIDGKFRYLKKQRVEIYKTMRDYINGYTHTPFIYLCMESGDVWYTVFGKDYKESEDLERNLAEWLRERFF
jgi:spore photoproduct lyase